LTSCPFPTAIFPKENTGNPILIKSLGNPRSRQVCGCTAGVITETSEKFLEEYDNDNKWQVKNITGSPAKIVYSAIKYGNPIIVWGSIDMEEIIENHVSWVDKSTGNAVS